MKRVVAGFFIYLFSLTAALASEPPRVVVSIKPIHALVSGLMEGVGAPALIVKGSSPPHTYALSDDDRALVAKADLLVWVGPELESFLADSRPENPTARTLRLLDLEALKILPERGDSERRDPYFWLDTRNALMLLHILTQALSDVDPARAHLYRNNHKTLRRSLAELDRAFEYGYRGVSGRPVLLYHDTQQYFEQAYAMRTMGYLTDKVGETAGALKLLEAKRALDEVSGTICLLTEAGLPTGNLDLLSNPQKARVVELDSHGIRFSAGPGLYKAMMQHNFDAIQACFDRSR